MEYTFSARTAPTGCRLPGKLSVPVAFSIAHAVYLRYKTVSERFGSEQDLDLSEIHLSGKAAHNRRDQNTALKNLTNEVFNTSGLSRYSRISEGGVLHPR